MLTPDQQQAIDRHLRQTNLITNEDLLLELADHFTTAITKRIETGESFEVALAHVHETFGGWTGLIHLQKQYVHSQNRAAWSQFRRVALSYLLSLKLLPILAIGTGIYWLLTSYGKWAFIGLLALHVVLYIVVCWPAWKWEPERWQHEWDTLSVDGYFNKIAGTERIVSILILIAFNLPIWLYLNFFPFTFNRPFTTISALIATVGIAVSYVGFACIYELTSHQNPLFKTKNPFVKI